MLKVGDAAPDFSLPNADMHLQSLGDYGTALLVLYFYPRNDTPGCTLHATDFTEMINQFEAAGARVVGVSQDDCFSHQAFQDKFGLKVELLSDEDGEACECFGVLQEREKNGVRRIGIVRSTFVVDRAGIIRYARYGVSPGHHAEEVLQVVRGLHDRKDQVAQASPPPTD